MSNDIEYEIARQRLWDEWCALGTINIAQLAGETYEENLRRRAEITVRRNEIWKKMGIITLT